MTTTDKINISIAVLTSITVIVTVTIFILQSFHNKKIIIFDSYNELYKLSFELRDKISGIIGTEWYYEVALLTADSAAEESVLDYINYCCNFFINFTNSKIIKRHWLKLMPLKLFNRLIALLPYIDYIRRKNNDKLKFQPYVDLLYYCSKHGIIKERYFSKKKYIWVGIRESDVAASSDYVAENISIFPDNGSVRYNHNLDNFDELYRQRIQQAYKTRKSTPIMFYNQFIAYRFQDEFDNNFVAVNDKSILNILNDKFTLRAQLCSRGLPCIPSEKVNSVDYHKLCAQYKQTRFVLQNIYGGGGYETYLLDNTNYVKVCDKIKYSTPIVVASPYLENNIPINIHTCISEKQTVIFPGSIQIIELHDCQLLYRGADFIAFRELDESVKKKVAILATKVADYLRSIGYRGVAGIDMLYTENGLYISEINPRFQASSYIIDKYMADRNKTSDSTSLSGLYANSLIELNNNAFAGIVNTCVDFNDEINCACYFYYADDADIETINHKLKLLKQYDCIVDTDGYCETKKIDRYSYLYRVLFNEKIAQISPDNTIWVADNIRLTDIVKTDKIRLKIALLNQGVRIQENSDVKSAVFEAIDFYIKDVDLHVNSPIKSHFIGLSPFEVVAIDAGWALFANGKKLSDIDVEINKIKETENHPERYSLYMSTDRLRINPANGCQYRAQGIGCYFCNLPPLSHEYTIEELEAASAYGLSLNPRHIMIGGGTINHLGNIDVIKKLVSYIKQQKPGIEISLMSVPPESEQLEELYQSGITDISLNMEVFDAKVAAKLMPAKSNYTRDIYWNTLKAAKKYWNVYGDVRSMIIVGLEKTDSLLLGIKKLNDIGVQPVLSVFRPLFKSNMRSFLPPSNDYLLEIYSKIIYMLQPSGSLGPKCNMCKNNTLAI